MPLDGHEVTFGRSDECTYRIDDERLSRKHFRLSASRAGYVIEDLESTNGTFMNDLRLTGPTPLPTTGEGAVLSAGDCLFVVDVPLPSAELPVAPDASGAGVTEFVGISSAAQMVRAAIETVAEQPGSVLLLGPSGAGKEVTARAIHRMSGRTGRFVPVNCASISQGLAEAELFGYEKGAFTGADRSRQGFVREASGGTLFLDEIGDMPQSLQAMLLRVLEDGIVQPIAGRPEKVDLRVVAATNRAVDERSGFRQDLFARLADWMLRLPPLARRRADILTLWGQFLPEARLRAPEADVEYLESLLVYDWPGNVRELRSQAQKQWILSGKGSQGFSLDMLPASMRIRPRTASGRSSLERTPSATPLPEEPATHRAGGRPAGQPAADRGAEHDRLKRALFEVGGNVKAAAERLGLQRTQLYRRLKRLGIDPDDFRPPAP